MSVPVREVACPTCNSAAWEACTQSTNTGRTPVTWFHDKRTDLANETEAPDPAPSPGQSVADAVLTALQNDPTVSFVACDCGSDLEISHETTMEDLRTLIEHAAFAHTGRRDVHVYRHSTLLSGNELGLLLRLAPVTESERAWRDSRA